jgi:uncharacterized membrane protein
MGDIDSTIGLIIAIVIAIGLITLTVAWEIGKIIAIWKFIFGG